MYTITKLSAGRVASSMPILRISCINFERVRELFGTAEKMLHEKDYGEGRPYCKIYYRYAANVNNGTDEYIITIDDLHGWRVGSNLTNVANGHANREIIRKIIMDLIPGTFFYD
jgi:hypothetical protein